MCYKKNICNKINYEFKKLLIFLQKKKFKSCIDKTKFKNKRYRHKCRKETESDRFWCFIELFTFTDLKQSY